MINPFSLRPEGSALEASIIRDGVVEVKATVKEPFMGRELPEDTLALIEFLKNACKLK